MGGKRGEKGAEERKGQNQDGPAAVDSSTFHNPFLKQLMQEKAAQFSGEVIGYSMDSGRNNVA
jgi:hypothetical protein